MQKNYCLQGKRCRCADKPSHIFPQLHYLSKFVEVNIARGMGTMEFEPAALKETKRSLLWDGLLKDDFT
jgi:hypothetical protein